MFRLIITVKQGVSSDLEGSSAKFGTVETARAAAMALMRKDVVAHVMITDDSVPPHFVEWAA